jgi:serine/threonine protein kinase
VKYAKREELKTFYTLIFSQKPRHVINLSEEATFGRNHWRLHLSPVGSVVFPRSISELKNSVRQILRGLQWLHAQGFVHRDSRWNNIIKDPNDCIRIIDFEHFGREGFVDFALSIWPILDDNCYTKRVDFYLLRVMVLDVLTKLQFESEARDFCNLLSQIDTADEALSHYWLIE